MLGQQIKMHKNHNPELHFLYGVRCSVFRVERSLNVLENRRVKRISGTKRQEVK